MYPCEAITTSKMVTTSSPQKFPVPLCKSSFLPHPTLIPRHPLTCFLSLQISLHFFLDFYINGIIHNVLFFFFFFFLVWLFFAQQNYFEVCPHFWVLQKFIPFYCRAVFRGLVVPDFVDSIACLWTFGVPLLVAYGAALVAQLVKNPPAMWDTWVPSLG